MNKTTEALRLAEEALDEAMTYTSCESWSPSMTKDCAKALAAIREVLAKPEITTPDVCGEVCARAKLCYGCGKALDEANAKLNNDHAWLSKEELTQYWKGYGDGKREALAEPKHYSDCSVYADPIVLGTECDCGGYKAEPVKQEPVAMVVSKCGDPESFGERELEVLIDIQALPYDTPFYASPVSAKREWVDLTDDEIGAVMDFGYATDSELENAHAVITAFKEKNKC